MHFDVFGVIALFLGNVTGLALFYYLKDKYDKKKKEKQNVGQST